MTTLTDKEYESMYDEIQNLRSENKRLRELEGYCKALLLPENRHAINICVWEDLREILEK